MRLAVIGSGISGLGAAWLLSAEHDVTVLEKRDRLGGHTHTYDVPVDAQNRFDPDGSRTMPVDTGFIVHNVPTYPLLTRLFDELGVETVDSDMSFAVRVEALDYEYAGSLGGMLAQPRNLLNPDHFRLIRDIRRFFTLGTKMASGELPMPDTTLGEFLREGDGRRGFSDAFASLYLKPMAAAIWSTGTGPVEQFPIRTLLTFFRNHGLLGVTTHHPWRTVAGGTSTYVPKLVAGISGGVRTGVEIEAIDRHDEGVTIRTTSGPLMFDGVVIATHADQALALLADPTTEEKELLGAWRYSSNDTWLHTDDSLLPRSPRARASWNYLLDDLDTDQGSVSLSYWMNRLQNLPTDQDVVVTLNPSRPPASHTVITRMTYRHPVFEPASVATQDRLHELNGVNRTWFAGAWQRYGFHEDGFWSAVRVARDLGIDW